MTYPHYNFLRQFQVVNPINIKFNSNYTNLNNPLTILIKNHVMINHYKILIEIIISNSSVRKQHP